MKNRRCNWPSTQIRPVKRILPIERFIGSIWMREDSRAGEFAKFGSRNYAASRYRKRNWKRRWYRAATYGFSATIKRDRLSNGRGVVILTVFPSIRRIIWLHAASDSPRTCLSNFPVQSLPIVPFWGKLNERNYGISDWERTLSRFLLLFPLRTFPRNSSDKNILLPIEFPTSSLLTDIFFYFYTGKRAFQIFGWFWIFLNYYFYVVLELFRVMICLTIFKRVISVCVKIEFLQ